MRFVRVKTKFPSKRSFPPNEVSLQTKFSLFKRSFRSNLNEGLMFGSIRVIHSARRGPTPRIFSSRQSSTIAWSPGPEVFWGLQCAWSLYRISTYKPLLACHDPCKHEVIPDGLQGRLRADGKFDTICGTVDTGSSIPSVRIGQVCMLHGTLDRGVLRSHSHPNASQVSVNDESVAHRVVSFNERMLPSALVMTFHYLFFHSLSF
jgi:hypothetical protein